MNGLRGRTAVVTGAASGIGRACALAFAREGAEVVAADVDEAGSAQTCQLAAAAGGRARAWPLDVTEPEGWAGLIGDLGRGDGLAFLVNNAALCIGAPVLEMSLESWRRQMAVNLEGVFLGTRAAIPLIAAGGGGAIVNLSSVAGLKGVAGLSGYCASKAGVRLFTKAVALECAAAANNIRVNSVHPGGVETPIWIKMAHDGRMPDAATNSLDARMDEARAATAAATPLGFAGQPADIAEGVLYLCSDEARFITGTELVIDGGVMAG